MSTLPTANGHASALRSPLAAALGGAEERTLGELAMVRTSLGRAIEAATTRDAAIAAEVSAQRVELDRRYGEVHDQLLALIARQSPAARDLRLAMALLHVNDRTERMEAQCANIATLCGVLPTAPAPGQLECLATMGDLAAQQVSDAATVFAERDTDGVRRLRDRDAAINEHNRRCFERAVADGGDEPRREAAFLVAMMARAIERIGDNAVDIGQQAAFVVTGRMRPPSGS